MLTGNTLLVETNNHDKIYRDFLANNVRMLRLPSINEPLEVLYYI